MMEEWKGEGGMVLRRQEGTRSVMQAVRFVWAGNWASLPQRGARVKIAGS